MYSSASEKVIQVKDSFSPLRPAPKGGVKWP